MHDTVNNFAVLGKQTGSRRPSAMPHHCSLSVHDESVSSADVLLNLSIFPTGAFEPGAVVRLIALDDDQTRNAETALGKSGISVISGGQQGQPTGRKALPRDIEDSESFDRKHDGNQDPDTTKGYIFKAQDAGPEMLAKAIDAQVRHQILSLTRFPLSKSCSRYHWRHA